ncbi:hypothetical protein [Diaminobutyricimonas sp. LJ205]|uniref:hypothetical protein n=1 Tax=Diaminobutyricimonas sp. LJ205 TaxID=2683590 RepID=UPI0018DFAFEF|nr:hypothetical protein [Diaminobutyricimonas sp. LJ205]
MGAVIPLIELAEISPWALSAWVHGLRPWTPVRHTPAPGTQADSQLIGRDDARLMSGSPRLTH